MYPLTLKFELDGIRQSVSHMFAEHHCGLQEQVEKALLEVLTEEWVAHRVKESVRQAVEEAIDQLSDNLQLRLVLKTEVLKVIKASIEDRNEKEPPE